MNNDRENKICLGAHSLITKSLFYIELAAANFVDWRWKRCEYFGRDQPSEWKRVKKVIFVKNNTSPNLKLERILFRVFRKKKRQ